MFLFLNLTLSVNPHSLARTSPSLSSWISVWLCVSLCLHLPLCLCISWSTLLKGCFVYTFWRSSGNVTQTLDSAMWLAVITFFSNKLHKVTFLLKQCWMGSKSFHVHSLHVLSRLGRLPLFNSCSNISVLEHYACVCLSVSVECYLVPCVKEIKHFP